MITQISSTPTWTGPGVRIGAVSYLNSKPLISGLQDRYAQDELVLDVPSRLADDLARGDLDVALIPSVEAFSDPDYEVISDACVATHGPVLSVKLYSRVPPGEIQTLALDEGSRTSAALVKVILAHEFGVHPKLESLPLGCDVSDTNADAILLIGVRAMFAPKETFHTVFDLGKKWVEWTGLPFVFAMWVTRRSANVSEVADRLSFARDHGVAHLDEIAATGAKQLNLSRKVAEDYLKHNLHFRLGGPEREGLRLFHSLVKDLGLIPGHDLLFRSDINDQPQETKETDAAETRSTESTVV